MSKKSNILFVKNIYDNEDKFINIDGKPVKFGEQIQVARSDEINNLLRQKWISEVELGVVASEPESEIQGELV